MKALNIANARINKWVKSPKEASEEFDITEEEATQFFDRNFKLVPSALSHLLPASPSRDEPGFKKGEVSLFD